MMYIWSLVPGRSEEHMLAEKSEELDAVKHMLAEKSEELDAVKQKLAEQSEEVQWLNTMLDITLNRP